MSNIMHSDRFRSLQQQLAERTCWGSSPSSSAATKRPRVADQTRGPPSPRPETPFGWSSGTALRRGGRRCSARGLAVIAGHLAR